MASHSRWITIACLSVLCMAWTSAFYIRIDEPEFLVNDDNYFNTPLLWDTSDLSEIVDSIINQPSHPAKRQKFHPWGGKRSAIDGRVIRDKFYPWGGK